MPKAKKFKGTSRRLVVSWDERFKELKEYKEKHNHCNVSTKDKANKALGTWVHNQRTKYKNEKLSPEQIKSMNGIGFEWELRTYVPLGWDERFEQLKEYKQVNGNCNVSTYDEDKANPELGVWVTTQRTAKKGKGTNKISPEQINRLEGIGFKWVLGRGYKPTREGYLDAAETENLVSGGEDNSSSRDTQIMIPLHRLPPIVWPATKSTNP